MDASEILQRANRQLLQENALLKAAARQRAADAAVMATEGLGVLLEEAAKGNAGARQVLDALAGRLEEVRALRSGIVAVHASPPEANGGAS